MSIRTHIPFFALVLVGFAAGCGSNSDDSAPATETDAGVVADTAPDTQKPPADAAAETAPSTCESALPSDFACVEPEKGTPATTCTEEMLADFVQKCLATDLSVPSTCDAWKTANPACATCVASFSWSEIDGQVYPDDYKCYWGIMDPACAKAANCTWDCEAAACGDCDSSTPDGAGKTESDYCVASVTNAGGKCYAVAAQKSAECFKTYKLDNCNVDEIYSDSPNLTTMQQQILRFYRGACRDNGNWTNATSAGGDAGTSDAAGGG
jgi:hypothetical protein